MSDVLEQKMTLGIVEELDRVTELLGGRTILRHALRTQLEAHEMLRHGLPGGALSHLIDQLSFIQTAQSLGIAVGMSLRTFQRLADDPTRVLSQTHSARTWKFAEILAKAEDVLGSLEEAEQWLERPAIGLDQRRPIDLLETPAGVELVEDLLGRIEYGVYT